MSKRDKINDCRSIYLELDNNILPQLYQKRKIFFSQVHVSVDKFGHFCEENILFLEWFFESECKREDFFIKRNCISSKTSLFEKLYKRVS